MNDFIDYFICKKWMYRMMRRLTPKYHKIYATRINIKSPCTGVQPKKVKSQATEKKFKRLWKQPNKKSTLSIQKVVGGKYKTYKSFIPMFSILKKKRGNTQKFKHDRIHQESYYPFNISLSDYLKWVQTFLPLQQLENWSQEFWKVDNDDLPAVFAQKGYEDKGYGHIKRIISNVADVLEKHSQLTTGIIAEKISGTYVHDIKQGIQIENQYFQPLRPTITLFYCAAHLHDVGMKFAGMYEALAPLIKAGGDYALHVSTIIHNYHHYSSFILLIELFHLGITNGKWPEMDNINGENDTIFLKHLFTDNPNKSKKELKERDQLAAMSSHIQHIYEKHFKESFQEVMDLRDFFVILAILCLFHQETDHDYIQSIIRKFKSTKYLETVECVNRWLDFFKRMDAWTKNTKKQLPNLKDKDINFSGREHVILRGKDNAVLDLHLAEALLQYGDKTEISIARVARGMGLLNGNPNDFVTPLKKYLEDIQYDNNKGFICSDMARRKISQYARFRACRFIPVAYVEVREAKTGPNTNLNIFIHYLRFDGDRDIFKLLRFKNEKDFHDLDFLTSMHIHLPMILQTGKVDQGIENVRVPIITFTLRRIEHDFFEQYANLIKEYEEQQFSDSLHGIQMIHQRIVEEKNENISQDTRFPYTKQNRTAVIEFCMEVHNPEAKNKSQGKKEVI